MLIGLAITIPRDQANAPTNNNNTPINLTNHPGNDYNPQFCSNGSKIVFESWRTGNCEIFIMNHGTSSLATAGTGDVLSGILGSLLSQGYSPDDAAIFATYLHSECARLYNNILSQNCLVASDLITMLPYAFNEIRNIS